MTRSFKKNIGILIGLMVTALALHAHAGSDMTVLDFEDLAHGQVVHNYKGVSIHADNRGGGPDLAVVFDSREKNTADSDLQGPYKNGNGSISRDWNMGNIDRLDVLGNLLIIQEHGYEQQNGMISSRPDDEGSRPAGSLYFTFSKPVSCFGFDLIDVEGSAEFNNGGGYVATFSDGVTSTSVGFGEFINASSAFYQPGLAYGNNSANRIATLCAEALGLEEIRMVEISMGGSGAIDNVRYSMVPTPAAVWPGLALLGGLILRRRRG